MTWTRNIGLMLLVIGIYNIAYIVHEPGIQWGTALAGVVLLTAGLELWEKGRRG